MKSYIPYILSFSAMLAISCNNDDPNGIIQPDPEVTPTPDPTPEQHAAVSFSSILQEEISSTRAGANTRASKALDKDFVVYGYKIKTDNSSQIVFNGYNVKYSDNSSETSVDNSHGFSYVGGTSINNIKQEIKYWDYSANEYRYWGYVENDDKISPTNDGKTLTIEGLLLGITEQTDYYISSLKTVPKGDFGKVVQMEFIRPYAKVRVMVYSGEKLEAPQDGNEGDAIELTDISFGPNVEEPKIVKSATINVTYPLSDKNSESYSIVSQIQSYLNKFEFKGFDASIAGSGKVLKLTSENCASNTAAVAYPKDAEESNKDNQTFYYVLPTGTDVTAPDYKFSVNVDGDTEPKTAIVPSAYMHWKPNYQYTYIFKVLEGGLLFVDANITEWQSGGSTSDQWTNW